MLLQYKRSRWPKVISILSDFPSPVTSSGTFTTVQNIHLLAIVSAAFVPLVKKSTHLIKDSAVLTGPKLQSHPTESLPPINDTGHASGSASQSYLSASSAPHSFSFLFLSFLSCSSLPVYHRLPKLPFGLVLTSSKFQRCNPCEDLVPGTRKRPS